jgi:glutamate racemase
MVDKNSYIGIFDSGVGGLGVMNTLLKVLPSENFLYIADSVNFPYGIKTERQIVEFSSRIVHYLLLEKVKAIVVACNTVSSIAIPVLQRIAGNIPVFGMIQSGAELALEKTKNYKIGVISTPLTAKMHAYKREIQWRRRDTEVFEVGSQELVNLVEDGNSQKKAALLLARERLSGLINNGVDTLVLGCTHFPFLYKVVRSVVGGDVEIIDPADKVSMDLQNYLLEQGLTSDGDKASRFFLTTGDKNAFLEKAKIFLNIDVDKVKHIDI